MTTDQILALAEERGFKSDAESAAFCDGYRAREKGTARAAGPKGNRRRGAIAAAWIAGWDAGTTEPEPYERTVTVGAHGFPVFVTELDGEGGFDVLVPLHGHSTTVHGATEADALAAARRHIFDAQSEHERAMRGAATGDAAEGADTRAVDGDETTTSGEDGALTTVQGGAERVPAEDAPVPDGALIRAVTVREREFTVTLVPRSDAGFDGTVMIDGKPETVYADSEREVLEEAELRIAAVLDAFTEPGPPAAGEDAIVEQHTLHVEVNDATHLVHVRKRASGQIELIADAFPDVACTADDETAGAEKMRELLEVQFGLREAHTVDGQRANVILDGTTGAPKTAYRQPLPDMNDGYLLPEDWLVVVAEKQARVDAAARALKPYKVALKDAEDDLEATVRKVAEAGAEIREPSLPLGAPA